MESDLVFNLTSYTLLAMSALTWTIAIAKVLQLRLARSRARMLERSFDASMDWSAFKEIGGGRDSGDAVYLTDRIKRVCRDYAGPEHASYSFEQLRAMLAAETQRKLGTVARHKESWLNALASISATAPFLGLFGTVWGIMKALETIGETGAANITVVAAPIGGALVTTAVGIVTAVPAVVFYNVINRMVRQHVGRLESFSEGLLRYVLHHRPHWQEIDR
ncbi:UNVERIFIED_CONTAM: MotA/TolQ/ExbB proton channel family protein [Spiribacter pallidus]|jgi:biopolymer transport protein ExbB